MTKLNQDLRWTPFLSLLNKEVQRFLKVSVQTVVAPIINSILYLLIFGVSLGAFVQIEGGIAYLSFLVPGLVMMGAINNAFQNSSSSIIAAKFSGDLEDLKVAPLSYGQILSALAIGGLIRGIMVGAITLIVGEIFHYYALNQWLAIKHPGVLMIFIVIGGVAFALLGLATAFWAKNFDQIAVVNSFILLPLIYLGGVFYSVDTLHPFWQSVSKLNPLLYFINGVRYGLIGVTDVSIPAALVVGVVTLLVFYIIAFLTLRRVSFVRW